MTTAVELGRRIRDLRTERGLTQDELAKGAYIGAYVSHVEHGNRNPSTEFLAFVASKLGADLDELIGKNTCGCGVVVVGLPLPCHACRLEANAKTWRRQQLEATHNCEQALTDAHGSLTSGFWQEGAVLTCSCGREWVHVCDEAEGCCWMPNEASS